MSERPPWEEYRATSAPPDAPPWIAYRQAEEGPPTVSQDLARTVPTAVAGGVAAWLGGPADLVNLAGSGLQWAEQKLTGETDAEYAQRVAERRTRAVLPPEMLDQLGSRSVTRAIEKHVTGPLYQPQTAPGEYLKTAGEFAPNALGGPAGWLRAGARVGVPAVVSETAGQATKGTAAEPWARAVGAVAGGGATAIAQRPRGARAVTSQALGTAGVTDQEIARAGQLIDDAGRSGITLTWDEALNQVTHGRATRLSQLRRVAENSEGGAPLARIAAERPDQLRASGTAQIDTVAPNPYPADRAAQAGQEAAQGAIQELRTRGQARVGPFYERAADDAVPADRVQAAIASIDDLIARQPNPTVTQGLRDLRAQLIEAPAQPGLPGTPATRTPVLGPNGQVVRYESTPAIPPTLPTPEVPRTSVGELDRVYRSNRDIHTGPPVVGETGTERAARRVTLQGLEEINTPLVAASDDLAAGRTLHSRWAERVVTPAEQGPLGRVAGIDPASPGASAKQGAALAGVGESDRYAGVVQQAVRRMVRQDPRAAETMARDYIADVFNRAVGDLSTGANQYGAAGFRAALVGDPASMNNLRAMVTQLPQGQARWAGFQRFLDVAEATGYRPVKGSDTAFNQAVQAELKSARGPIGAAIEEASKGGLGLKQAVTDMWARYRLGQNTGELARMLTDPQAAPLLRALARAPVNSTKAQAITLRLGILAVQQGAPENPGP